MKQLLIIVALIGSVAFRANAQSKVEELLKVAEKAVKLADQNPQDGLKQLAAARALVADSLGDKCDLDRAQVYALKAYALAIQALPERKDTLLGNSCVVLGGLSLMKHDIEHAFEYYEMAIDAYDRELGCYDPVSIGSRLGCFVPLISVDPRRAFPFILQAFCNNEKAPADKKIENMDWAGMGLAYAMEYLLADYTLRFNQIVPLVMFEGERYLVLEGFGWHIGTPFVNWFAPYLINLQKTGNSDTGGFVLLNDQTGKIRRIAPDYKNRPNFTFDFRYDRRDPRHLQLHENNACTIVFKPEQYNKFVEMYNQFISKEK